MGECSLGQSGRLLVLFRVLGQQPEDLCFGEIQGGLPAVCVAEPVVSGDGGRGSALREAEGGNWRKRERGPPEEGRGPVQCELFGLAG